MPLRLKDLKELTGGGTSRPKFNNRTTELDGVKFDSAAEARRWAELQVMQRAGLIRNLTRQQRFELVPAVRLRGAKRDTPAITYVADFCYEEADGGWWRTVVEDVKGVRTAAYKLKRHLMKALRGLDIRETGAR